MKTATATQIDSDRLTTSAARTNYRSEALAARLEAGAAALAAFAAALTETEWQTPLPHDGRKIGVVVHHVASMYPVEIQLAQLLAAGQPVTGVTWDVVAGINSDHAKENDAVAKDAALALLAGNSAVAAAAIRVMGDEELDRAAPISLNSDAPLTCQFFLEDHPVRAEVWETLSTRGVDVCQRALQCVAHRTCKPTCRESHSLTA